MKGRRAAAAAGLALSACALHCGATEPSRTVTRLQGEMAFSMAVVMSCLTAQEQQRAIADLPPVYRTGLMPAEGDDLQMGAARLPPGRTWISTVLGSHLRLIEKSPDHCEIIADQLPVDDTLRRTLEVTTKLKPPFAPVPVAAGYNPVVLESRRSAAGRIITVHLEGAEPGLPDHWSHFALLQATVTSTPSAPPP